MNKINRITQTLAILALAVSLCIVPQVASAQGTALTATTLSTAVTSASATTITLASSTGVTAAGSLGQFNTVLYIGKELIGVNSLVSGTTWKVTRGLQATRPLTYLSGAAVLLGAPSGNFLSADYSAEVAPGSACVAINSLTLPLIYLKSGHSLDCMGVSGTQQWTITNSDERPTLGTTVASTAGVITPTGIVFTVSGTAAITGIAVPKGFIPGMSIKVTPSGVFTWTAATNISLAGTAVVGKVIIFVWNGTSWFPSYIA